MIEQTLVVLKPDTVKRALIGEIIGRFERADRIDEVELENWGFAGQLTSELRRGSAS